MAGVSAFKQQPDVEVQALVTAALEVSTADGCIVIAEDRSETNLRWAANSLTTNGQMSSRSMSVISTFTSAAGTCAGVVSRPISQLGEIRSLVEASEAAARAAGPSDDAAPLIEPYDGGDVGWFDAPAATSVEVFADFTGPLGRALRASAARDRALFGFAEHVVTSTFLATSTGLRRRHDQPTGRLELNAKSGNWSGQRAGGRSDATGSSDGTGSQFTGSPFTRSAWDGVATRDFRDVDITALVDGLDTRLDWAARHIDLPAGRYETLLPPCAVADLMIDAYWSGSARDAEEGRSVYSGRDGRATRVGERLSSLPLTLYSDPSAPGVQCAPFEIATSSAGGMRSVFDNGAPITRADWVRDGVLTELIRTRSWAARTGAAPRLAVDNLVLDAGGTASLPEMIASTERGLLLTTLWYIRTVDPQTLLLTGLTRDGVYLIENGRVQGAVNNFRWNESPVDLLGRITEAGRTQATLPREWNDYFTRTVMPPLRVPDFNMSTVSAAN